MVDLLKKMPALWQAALVLVSSFGAGATTTMAMQVYVFPAVTPERMEEIADRSLANEALGLQNAVRLNSLDSDMRAVMELLDLVALDTCVLRERMPEDRNAIPPACRSRPLISGGSR